ncbi:TM2 domain-containing protein [Murimonas intestini]|uniref:TM2 domain-containing protein n=1 Tax=Murimonas intestini TaxID=1337051 RepID=UPI0011DD6C00|nr:TM2 domain-containing protein [Murimonas intestini]
MALIQCPECGKEISDKAPSCPNCGTPFNQKKYCKFCGGLIDMDCIICPKCGKQVEELNNNDRNIVINNNNNNVASSSAAAYASIDSDRVYGRPKNKWVSLLLCFFTICGHKFYEGKIGMGFIYFFTIGLFGIGWMVDLVVLLLKPNPYYV